MHSRRYQAAYKGLKFESDTNNLKLLERWSDASCHREHMVKIKYFRVLGDCDRLVVLCRHSLPAFRSVGDVETDEANAFRLLADWLKGVPELPKSVMLGRRSVECWWLPVDLEPQRMEGCPIPVRAEFRLKDNVSTAVETALMISPKNGPAFVRDWLSQYPNDLILALRRLASGGDDYWCLDELIPQVLAGHRARLVLPRFIVPLTAATVERLIDRDPDLFVLLFRCWGLKLPANHFTTEFERLAEELERAGSIPDFSAAYQKLTSSDSDRNPLGKHETEMALEFLELIKGKLTGLLRESGLELETLVEFLLPIAEAQNEDGQ